MKYVNEADLRAHLINDGCDDGCGYLDERDIPSLPWIELDATDDDVLDKIRAEIENIVWEDIVVSFDGTNEIRIPRLDPDDVFEIIDKYRKEQE